MLAMKIRLLILAMTLCMSATGCSSFGEFVIRVPAHNTSFRNPVLSPDALQPVALMQRVIANMSNRIFIASIG
ncbi:MAG: hypothetical protein QNJ04_05005, partial [Desulfobacterales bacterium]|nr:hypothetical protein [Desulfobacterales bacterium]